jgi:hypothetical protein
MKNRIWINTWMVGVAFIAVHAASTLVCADAEDEISKTFNPGPGGKLVIEVDRGSITVKGTDSGAVTVQVSRKAKGWSESGAREILDKHQVTINQEGSDVVVRARMTGGELRNLWSGGRNLQVRYEITVPHKFNLEAQTAGGAIQVQELEGKIKATTAGGGMDFAKIKGPIEARTSGGGINVADCTGNVNVDTAGGGIKIGEVGGEVVAQTSGGGITVQKVEGRVKVRTSGGGIRIDNAGGEVSAETSGGPIETRFGQVPRGEVTLHTSGGGITVRLPESAGIDLDARSSGGSVKCDFPITLPAGTSTKRDVLVGKINGGGAKVVARTSGGGISIQKD